MVRRKFLYQGVLAGSSIFLANVVQASLKRKNADAFAEQPFHLDYAIHDGMFKNNGGPDFIEQIRFAYQMGFRAIEDNGMMDRPAEQQEKIGNELSKLGMRMGVFVNAFD